MPDNTTTSASDTGLLDLVSGAEIGRRLGVSRQAVSLWTRNDSYNFPEPLAHVGNSIVWDWRAVEAWATENR